MGRDSIILSLDTNVDIQFKWYKYVHTEVQVDYTISDNPPSLLGFGFIFDKTDDGCYDCTKYSGDTCFGCNRTHGHIC